MNNNSRWLVRTEAQGILAHIFGHALLFCAGLLPVLANIAAVQAQTPITVGYRDFSYGSTVFEAPTADKPQSKLWWNDGFWWGVLWQPAVNKYRIHRFDLPTQSWINVGPDIDDRPESLADALWDGQKLYIASHVYSGGSQTSGGASTANSARLYRYSYNAATDSYSLDAGFPVIVNNAICEALVLDKDSTGQLWVTWTQSSKVYLNRSLGDDLTWGTPFALPTQGPNTSSDDISTIFAYNGRLALVWSNQSDKKIYFATHVDSKADTDWEPHEIALDEPSLGAVADDHLNIKMSNDGGGNLYITTKTSLSSSSDPGIYLLKRSFSGVWSKYVMATKADDYTRPIVVIDDDNRELYVFGKSGSNIYKKKVSLDNISFPAGKGDAFIQSSSGDINDATSAKHNVNGATGLLILASDEVNRYYYHNYVALTSNSGAPLISAFSPASGNVGATVTITGNNFTGATNVAFNGTAAGFTVNSNTQITATVPAGATTGKISVTKSSQTAYSANNFTVTTPATQYALTMNTFGTGSVTLNPSGGVYDAGTMVTLTAMPGAGYQFDGWSGDLSGTSNPATITMDANKTVTATFSTASGGEQVVYQESATGSSTAITVATAANLTAMNGQLYLAAISSDPKVAVTTVSGLGLNWTLVKAQCSGKNKTGLEIWMALGAPSASDKVTATFAAKPSNAVIAVSRYANVNAANPIGNLIAGNTTGVNGACSGGVDNKAYSFNLATTVNGAVVYGAVALRDRSHTPGAGFTERAEIKKSKAAVAVEDKTVTLASSTTINGKLSGSVDWAFVGLEIKPPSSSGGIQYTLATNVIGSGSVTPSSGVYNDGENVTLTATPAAGFQFAGWSGDLSGGANPAMLTMDANKNVMATFTALPPPQHSLTVNTVGSGSVALDPVGGVYAANTMVTLTATPTAGFQFAGWSGDLSGATNPATITMDANKNVTANFVISGGSGQVVHQETVTGSSSSSVTVATSANLVGVNGDLYLAAIVSRSRRVVSSVSGLGLTWTLVKAQCSGRNLTGVEVWMAQGIPAGNGTVTATFASAPSNAVIAVSRYAGVAAVNPLGNVVAGNTVGVNGVCSGGTDNAAYSFNLTVTGNGAVIYGAAATRSTTHTPGAGYTERIEIVQGSSSPATVAVQDKNVAAAGTGILNGTFGSNNDWAVVGIELKPQLSMSKRATEATGLSSALPATFQLGANYPNPFWSEAASRMAGIPGTMINFSLPQASQVQLNIYDITGKLVRTLVAGEMAAGAYSTRWNGRDNFSQPVAAGMYLYKIDVKSADGHHLFTQTQRMTLLK
ncbi:MAG: hypothetical protein ALAOOOJD_02813 [bacterium]|nr:hypothetical protein [bacterium]